MIWDAHKYGWGSVYWLTVGGIPVVWTERATGLTLPSGFDVEDASLTIDASAEIGVEQIDRDRGTAVSLSLSFKILDTATTRDWLRRWSNQCTLTATMGGAVATVDDNTGWPAASAFFAGLERITYTATPVSTSFTGCTRGTSGSWQQTHKPGTTSQIVTDRPRFWRGRDVTLWATPIDPAGFVPGAALTDDAVIVWRGKLESGPDRVTDGFEFSASSLDRVLDQGLATQITGVVKDTAAKYTVSPQTTYSVTIQAMFMGVEVWIYTMEMQPFTGLEGTFKSGDDLRTLLTNAWDAAVIVAGAQIDIGAMSWTQEVATDFGPNGLSMTLAWTPRIQITANAGVDQLWHFVYIDGKQQNTLPDPNWINVGMPANLLALYSCGDNPTALWLNNQAIPGITSITLQVDTGVPADVPIMGIVLFEINNQKFPFAYQYATSDGTDVYLSGLVQAKGSKLNVADIVGTTATVQLSTSGNFPLLLLTTLENSGTGLRGAYDVGPRGKGYGIDSTLIKEISFTNADAPLGDLKGTLTADGGSFADRVGGALGLFRQAVVCRPDLAATYRAPKLTLISSAPYGSGYKTTITDADLLAHNGDPVVSVKRLDSANVAIVVQMVAGVETSLTIADNDQVDAVGRKEVRYEIPADNREALFKVARTAVAGHFAADQTVQAIEVVVPPWIACEVGDVVWLTSTHPALWTWTTSPGQPGYDGAARCVGRKINLKSARVTLTLLIDAATKTFALSPAAEVRAFDVATPATQIDVDLIYLDHFVAALADHAAPVSVLHYQVGAVETDGQGYSVTAAVEVAGPAACRLTVAVNLGAPVLSIAARSTLTLPTTTGGALTTYQSRFAHVDDGTAWG